MGHDGREDDRIVREDLRREAGDYVAGAIDEKLLESSFGGGDA